MTTEIGLLTAALAMVSSIVLGTLLGFWLGRRVNASQGEAISEKIRSESTSELATARERVRGLEGDTE